MNVFSMAGVMAHTPLAQLHLASNPPAKCALKNAVAAPFDNLVGNLEGLAPWAATLIGISIFVLMIILAASHHASTLMKILGIVILGVIGVGIIGPVIGVFTTSSC